jgi:hypothetical protein
MQGESRFLREAATAQPARRDILAIHLKNEGFAHAIRNDQLHEG